MKTSTLLKAIALLAVFAMSARISVDTDTWWHLRAGEWIVENRVVPHQDPFSYTRASADWNYPGWIVEIPMYLIYKTFGPGGLNVWTAVIVTLTFGFVWGTMSGGSFSKAFMIVLAAAASAVYWAARPYLVTFLLSAIFLWVLEDYRWGRNNRLYWLPLLMILWANSHGGFAVGFILIAIYTTDLAIRRAWERFSPPQGDRTSSLSTTQASFQQKLSSLLIVGLLCAGAVAINPSGPVMLLYPFKTVSIGALQDFIAEWQSPNFHELRVQPFIWLILLLFAAIGFSRRRIAISDFLLLSVFTYLSLTAARNIALFSLVAPVVITRYTAPMIGVFRRIYGGGISLQEADEPSRLAKTANLLIFAILAFTVAIKTLTIYPAPINEEYFRDVYPVGAVAYLKENRPVGELFNSYNWGGYLLWFLPEYPVFIDGRTDLYDDELIGTWLQVIRAEVGWEATLDSWDVDLVLLEPDYPIVAQLQERNWELLYNDENSVLYGRRR
jgi:hypothetical protein